MANNQESSFYDMGDEEMNLLATAAPLRVPRKGKADIGGRMRVTQILREAGISPQAAPERVAGSTNEVWRAGNYIIRVGFVPGGDRLRREAKLAPLLPDEVNYPPVVASGTEPFGEWIIVRHRPGVVLSEAWGHMQGQERQGAVHEIATAIKAVHETHFGGDVTELLAFHEGDGLLALPHQLPATRTIELLEEARHLPHMDQGLVNAAVERTEALADVIWEHERNGLVHGDLHFENVLAHHNLVIAILDFEWSRPAPREIDIDVLARFCASPDLHIGGSYPVNREDYRDVLRWFAEAYPEIFEGERFVERLTLCGLAFEVPWLLKFPPTGPPSTLPEFHPVNQLKDLLDKGTHAERLGWESKSL